MIYRESSLEFNLKDLLFYILYRWKPIVICAIIAALLLGLAQAYPQYKAATNEKAVAAYQEEYQNYLDQLSFYTENVSATQKKIDDLKVYMELSILMNADHRNLYVATSVYYIDTKFQIIPESQYQNPDKTKTVTWYYENHLNDYSSYTSLANTLGIDEKYLMELVDVDSVNGDTIEICVAHPDQAVAQTIVNYLDEVLLQYKDSLTPIVEDHTLTQLVNTCSNYVYEPVEQEQQKVKKQMQSLQEELSLQKQELKKFEEANEPDSVNILKTFIKWCVIGGLAGGVLLVVLFFLLGIFDSRAYSHDHLVSHYHITPLGGFLPSGTKFDFITKWLRKQECLLLKNSPENLQFLTANVENHCGSAREVLVCSDASTETTTELVSSLQVNLPEIHFTAAGSLFDDANALKSLPKCDSVLLLITRNQTCHKHICKSLSQIQECGKTVLGFIFVG